MKCPAVCSRLKSIRLPLLLGLLLLGVSLCLPSCREKVYTPKPRAYYRIDMPEPSYRQLDTTAYPYAFAYSILAEIRPRTDVKEPYWINLYYPAWNATLHVSYKRVNNNLDQLVEDARFFTTKQIPKAEDLLESSVYDTVAHVYGKIYEITGTHVACTYQFWLTDREKHFFRGALYFHTTPNNDSLAPVLQFVQRDMEHLIETFRWRE